jgi:pimeloyl-ACP methyl ester carboxylesterase
MFTAIMKKLVWLVAIGLFVQVAIAVPVRAEPAGPTLVRQLNFVFLHGAGGNSCSMQLLSDTILDKIEPYILAYEAANPEIDIQVDSLNRCYPNDVDMRSWANNIATSVAKYLPDKHNIILIGHSAGGKAALYAVANNSGALGEKTAMVVTIDTPVKSLGEYYATGGTSITDFCSARWLGGDRGICSSIANYDSSEDGAWVAENKHWLAFIAGSSAPSSTQFGYGGVDVWPRNMDDGIVPISAQYSDEADVVYYGQHGHSDFGESEAVASSIAEQILDYIFGGTIECSVFVRDGTFEHEANWLPGTEHWDDTVGSILVDSGRLEHFNESYFWWEEWQDVVGECPEGSQRSNYQVNAVNPFPVFRGVGDSYWFSSDDFGDCRLYIRSWAAPRNTVEVDWEVYRLGLLPEGVERARYEVEITTGTPLTSIKYVDWLTDDPRDLRLRVMSQAESPFRWFKAEWRVYSLEARERQIIDELFFDVILPPDVG